MKMKLLALSLLALLGLFGLSFSTQTNSQNHEINKAFRGNLFSERLIYAQGGGNGVEVPIPVGGVINGTTVILRADIYDSGASLLTPKTLKMEVEIKKIAVPFDGITGLYSSDSQVFSGGDPIKMSVQIDNLELGERYKWRVRDVNVSNGLASDWRDFGNNGDEPDFTITRVNRLELLTNKTEIEWGEKIDLTITAYDLSGVVADTYRGDVRIRSVSSNVSFSPDGVTFTSTDAGVVELPQSVSFLASGTYTIEIYDLANSMLTDTVDITVLPPKVPILQLSSDNTSIEAGDNVTLSWSSAFVNDIHLQYDTSDVVLTNPSGDIMVSPLVTTTFTLVGTGIYGENMSSTVTVEVSPYRTPVLELHSDVSEILEGDSVTLTWTSEYVENLTLTVGDETVDVLDLTELVVSPDSTTEYILRGTGVHGESMESKLTITVTPNEDETDNPDTPEETTEVVLTLKADKTEISSGDEINLSWKIQNVFKVVLYGNGEKILDVSILNAKSAVVKPTANIEYSLIGFDKDGKKVESKVQVTVTPLEESTNDEEVIIKEFRVSDDEVKPGDIVIVTWDVENADTVLLNVANGEVGSNGSLSVRVNDDMIVELKVIKDGKELTREIKISVQNFYTWELGGIGLGGLVLIEVLGFTFLPLQGTVPALGNLWYAILGLFESNKRKKPWGIVYDSVSKDVLGRSIVRVYDVITGKLLQTVVSQVNGMFNISLGKGKYRLDLSRAGYIFPSIIVVGKDDGGYPNVYKGEDLHIKTDKELVMISVPMDPENTNGLKKVKRSLGLRFYLLLSLLINAGFIFGFIYTIYVTYQNNVLYNWIVSGLYGIIILGKLLVLVFKPRSY
jgi:hypothetical protein